LSYRVLDRPTWNGLDGRIVNCNTVAAFKTYISMWFQNYGKSALRGMCTLMPRTEDGFGEK